MNVPLSNEREVILMGKQPSWDDIPSLGLQLEQDELGKRKDKRAEIRLPCEDLLELFMLDTGKIIVQVVSGDGRPVKKGLLRDINQKGMGLLLQSHGLQKDDAIVLGTMLGRRGFKTKAVVRWTKADKVGVEYLDPRTEDYTFLSELYGAKILNNI